MELLKKAVNGKLVLTIPAYSPSQTTLDYEELITEMREPYMDLVRKGYLRFESRHGTRETYCLTTAALDLLKYTAPAKAP